MQDAFIKIPKDTLYDPDDMTSYKNLILSYLYFKRDFNNQITMSMSLMCQELNMTFGRQSSSGNQALNFIKLLIQNGTLILEPRLQCLSPSQISRSNLFVVTYNPPVSQVTSFVMLTLSEFNTLTSYLLSNEVSQRTDKLLKVYLYIKASLNTKNPDAALCISGATIRSLVRVGSSGAQEILDILEDAELITSIAPNTYSLTKVEKPLDKTQ